MVYGLWSMVYGLRPAVYGPWPLAPEVQVPSAAAAAAVLAAAGVRVVVQEPGEGDERVGGTAGC